MYFPFGEERKIKDNGILDEEMIGLGSWLSGYRLAGIVSNASSVRLSLSFSPTPPLKIHVHRPTTAFS